MFWRCILFFFLMLPSMLGAVASDAAIGKGRGLLWAVSNHWLLPRGKFGSLRDVPLRAETAPAGLIILTQGWHSSGRWFSQWELCSCLYKGLAADACPCRGLSQACAIWLKRNLLLQRLVSEDTVGPDRMMKLLGHLGTPVLNAPVSSIYLLV